MPLKKLLPRSAPLRTTTPARNYTYNHLGQLTQVSDDAGTRTIGYNRFDEQETDSLTTQKA